MKNVTMAMKAMCRQRAAANQAIGAQTEDEE
jgi:hypothetical protein